MTPEEDMVIDALLELARTIQINNEQTVEIIRSSLGDMAQTMEMVNGHMLQPVHNAIGQLAQSHAQAAHVMTAKKRITRGPDGRPDGVEVVT